MSIYCYLLDTFNWRKYPENVFYIAGPLAGLSFGLWLAVAVLHARQGGVGLFGNHRGTDACAMCVSASSISHLEDHQQAMTRVNVGIDPRELPRSALLAEHREMKRIPNQLRKNQIKRQHVPTFRLGTGHVLFFTTRMRYLFRRYLAVRDECWHRGYTVTDYEGSFLGFLKESSEYQPTASDRAALQARLIICGHVCKPICNRDRTL